VDPGSKTRLISYGHGGEATLHTLDAGLHDAQSPVAIGRFDVTQGCGYSLPDGSILLFGRLIYAAISWIDASGKSVATRSFGDVKNESFAISQAVQLSENKYLAIRYTVNAESAADNGLVMSWITLH
jgi:hypothetical protein